MSSTIELDFQDYAPNNSGDDANRQRQADVQIKIPTQTSTSGSSTSKQKQENSKFVLNALQKLSNLGSEQNLAGAGLSDDDIQQLIRLSNRQKSKQQRASKVPKGSWGLGLLADYFDVTTSDVIQRILWSAIPIRKEGIDLDEFRDADLTEPLNNSLDNVSITGDTNQSHLSDHFKGRYLSYIERFIQSRPDFYGPFWVSTTLVFAIAIFSNLARSIAYHAKLEGINHSQTSLLNANLSDPSISSGLTEVDDWHYNTYEMNMGASLISFYVTLVPSFLCLLFWLRGCAKYYTLTETICAYGYSLSIFIPLSALLMVQASIFRYLMITLAATLSGSVLVLSFLPMVNSDPNSGGSHFILVIVFGLQFCLAYILHRMMLQ